MPAPSNLDLKREHQGIGIEEKSHYSYHRFLARFLDKREMTKASCFESSVSKGSPPNSRSPSPTRQYANSSFKGSGPNPKSPSPTRQYSNSLSLGKGSVPNPKNPSPTRQDSNSTQPKNKAAAVNSIPRYRASGARTMPSQRSGSEVPVAPVARPQFPKPPLASLLKKNQAKVNEVNRLLITVNVLGSAGPLRFLVSCDDPVQKVVEIALKFYAREGRLPVLGQKIKQFELYCANSGCGEALDPSEIVGNLGTRNFLLCKKQRSKLQEEEKHMSASHHHHQKSNVWKNWLLTMSSSFGVSSH